VRQLLVTGLLWFGALGCGLLGGIYFAFSTFIMTALGRIERVQGISAMNAINAAILNSLFMPVFFGTTLASLILVIIGFIRRGESGAAVMLTGGMIYVAGMFLCTMLFNVPLNNALAAVDPASGAGAPVWARYLKNWTLWNHVRAISSTAASMLYIAAIAAR
jgi:uncharacterized membrane protein